MTRRRGVVIVLAVAFLVGLGVAAWLELGGVRAPAPRPRAAAPHPPAAATPAPPPAAQKLAQPAAPGAEPELPLGLGAVDLGEVRAALPDNLYWESAAPSDDPRVLEARERAAAFRNEQYGKILSGTGSDEVILDYYEHRTRASTDYIQFVDYLLEHHGSDLTDQDQTLLHLAKRLHAARLEEIPRRIQEARERQAAQDEARRAWREEEREFRGDSADAP